jgi:hypothetical protein
MSIDQHFCLFALALKRLIQKIKEIDDSKEYKINFEIFSKLVNFILT